MDICPTGAISKSSEGVTTITDEECIECGACLETCKYNAIKLAEKALICNQCSGEPECVKRGPTGALGYSTAPESNETPSTAFARMKELWNIG